MSSSIVAIGGSSLPALRIATVDANATGTEMSQESGDDLPTTPVPEGPAGQWMPIDLLAVYFLYNFWPALILSLGLLAGAFPDSALIVHALNHDEHSEIQNAIGQLAGPVAVKVTEADCIRAASIRVQLWAGVLAFPLQVVSIPLWFFWRCRTPPQVLGLTWRGWPRGLLMGILGAVVITPVVLLFHVLVVWLYGVLIKEPTEQHALVLLSKQNLMPVEWIFLLVLAIVAAPLIEEILFRGVVMAYLRDHPLGDYLILFLSLLIPVALNFEHIIAVQNYPGLDKLDAYMPVLFILVLGLGLLATREYAGGTSLPRIFATAMLFASVHPTWPHPIPLFVLGLALGYLRERSGSLLAPILVHALFNATSTVLYFGFGI
jgi:membrane protease YdiL (CAAX protease family)